MVCNICFVINAAVPCLDIILAAGASFFNMHLKIDCLLELTLT